ncbi:MAG TPA: lytic transglycosylase domain-containing protein [Beijerinckiaceae bacterium]|nr:lytic transglycosylase domain-containing protein [Beijerinckiaceae bacterium]
MVRKAYCLLLATAAMLAAGGAALASPESIRPLIARHAAANNVPFALADAVVRIESRYNPAARNRANLGLTQISHQTARGIGYRGAAAGLLSAETNLVWGMKYLGMAYHMANGNICGTVMRYQSGLMATRMSGANRIYCGKVQAILGGKGLRAS